MKKIVVAVEFDEELDDIVDFTVELLQEKESEVFVVHVYESELAVVDYAAPYMVDTIERHEERLQEQAKIVKEIVQTFGGKGVKAHGFMKPINKNVSNSILEFAGEKEAELIIVGTHHPNRVERFVLGSVAEKVIRNSSLPVMVVPRKPSS